MAPLMKRKVDGNTDKDRNQLSKKLKHSTSTHVNPGLAQDPSPRSSPDPSPAAGSTSEVEIEANENGPKSFQDLGIIDSLCDACTALGYKVPTSL